MRSVLRDLFGGPEFLSPQAFHGQIKQPVELIAGSLKALNVQNVGLTPPSSCAGWGRTCSIRPT